VSARRAEGGELEINFILTTHQIEIDDRVDKKRQRTSNNEGIETIPCGLFGTENLQVMIDVCVRDNVMHMF